MDPLQNLVQAIEDSRVQDLSVHVGIELSNDTMTCTVCTAILRPKTPATRHKASVGQYPFKAFVGSSTYILVITSVDHQALRL